MDMANRFYICPIISTNATTFYICCQHDVKPRNKFFSFTATYANCCPSISNCTVSKANAHFWYKNGFNRSLKSQCHENFDTFFLQKALPGPHTDRQTRFCKNVDKRRYSTVLWDVLTLDFYPHQLPFFFPLFSLSNQSDSLLC